MTLTFEPDFDRAAKLKQKAQNIQVKGRSFKSYRPDTHRQQALTHTHTHTHTHTEPSAVAGPLKWSVGNKPVGRRDVNVRLRERCLHHTATPTTTRTTMTSADTATASSSASSTAPPGDALLLLLLLLLGGIVVWPVSPAFTVASLTFSTVTFNSYNHPAVHTARRIYVIVIILLSYFQSYQASI